MCEAVGEFRLSGTSTVVPWTFTERTCDLPWVHVLSCLCDKYCRIYSDAADDAFVFTGDGTGHSFINYFLVVLQLTRERNVQEFLQESASFRKTPTFAFQPAPRDKVRPLVSCETPAVDYSTEVW